MDVIIIIIIPLFISLQWILCPLCSFFDSTTFLLSCCTRLLLFSKCGGSWEMLVHVCRLPLTGSSLWGLAVKFFFPSLFWIFFFSFQRQRLTQGPFRRFNSNKRFDFGYNSFDPHRVSFVTPHTLVHPHPAPLSQLPPSSFCHFIALSRPCSTGREKNQGKFGRKVKSQRELVGSNTGGVFVQDLVVL